MWEMRVGLEFGGHNGVRCGALTRRQRQRRCPGQEEVIGAAGGGGADAPHGEGQPEVAGPRAPLHDIGGEVGGGQAPGGRSGCWMIKTDHLLPIVSLIEIGGGGGRGASR